ncbi:NUDIX domain-containing protein [Streptomyces rectiverticillatus]|uniref:NUDIX domain-containing protein n=1 Tax=Streptomyces rectiverticillatus TaxID=173860 RepID=UPI0015C3F471|nr:NUDIX domain-containing protein [Streptomyces rectiverticillatus]QLE70813.1 NUDIX domain-containing protein [Streptomyces rectiverticillatus]
MLRGTWAGPDTFWLPGGGQNPKETLAACAEREVFEETGVRVTAGPLVALREYIQDNHVGGHQMMPGVVHRVDAMFWCSIVKEPAVLGGTEPDTEQTGVEWVELGKLTSLRTVPSMLARIITDVLAADRTRVTVYLGDTYA